MTPEAIIAAGKIAIVIIFVILGALFEWKEKDGEGYFWSAVILALFFGLL